MLITHLLYTGEKMDTCIKISKDGTILNADDVEYGLTPGLHKLKVQKHPQASQWTAITKYINLFLHRPGLDLTQIQEVLLDTRYIEI